jgi:heat shock protein HslJ
VNRISRSGKAIGEDQRLTPYEGLKCMTHWAAEQYDEADAKGTLETGKLADFVILDKDPLKVDPMSIKQIKIVETIKEGVTIYPAPQRDDKPVVAAKGAAMTYRWRAHVCDMAEVNQAAGKEWTLIRLNGKSIDRNQPPTIKFEGGKVSVFGGVNRISGSYALLGTQGVLLGQLSSTKMAGPPELVMLEREFSAGLASVDAFHVEGNRLDLLRGDEVIATFRHTDG